jgi:hypothetical protein
VGGGVGRRARSLRRRLRARRDSACSRPMTRPHPSDAAKARRRRLSASKARRQRPMPAWPARVPRTIRTAAHPHGAARRVLGTHTACDLSRNRPRRCTSRLSGCAEACGDPFAQHDRAVLPGNAVASGRLGTPLSCQTSLLRAVDHERLAASTASSTERSLAQVSSYRAVRGKESRPIAP